MFSLWLRTLHPQDLKLKLKAASAAFNFFSCMRKEILTINHGSKSIYNLWKHEIGSYEDLMGKCISLVKIAKERADSPVGAILV